MRKLLVLGYYFYPNPEIGAVRISEITQRLSNYFDVTVVIDHCEKTENCFNGVDFWYINDYCPPPQKAEIQAKGKNKNILLKILSNYRQHFRNIIASYKYLKKFVNMFENCNSKFDCVISSYGPLCNHLCGLYIKKKRPEVHWIADFRDPMDAPIIPHLFLPFMKFQQNKVCKKADDIVCVSNGYFQKIVSKKYRSKSNVIYNGYSKLIKNENLPAKFSFLYVGSMYGGTRKFSPLFSELKRLIEEFPDAADDIEINYIGRDNVLFEKQCKDSQLEKFYHYLGQMSRKECIINECNSYFLILSTWNLHNYRGVIPGKFYEYLSCGRKIISICTGNLVNSEVGQILSELKQGIAIEIDYSKDKVYNFIKNEYLSWKNNEYCIEQKDISRFSYDSIANEFLKLLTKEYSND